MSDISTQLLVDIQKAFNNLRASDPQIRSIERKITEGTVTHIESQKYAERVADHISKALRMNLKAETLPNGRMYFNIAEKTVRPAIEEAEMIIGELCEEVQAQIYANANLGIQTIKSTTNEDRLKAIIDKLSDDVDFANVEYVLDAPVKNCVRSTADDYMEKSAKRDSQLGLHPKVVRSSSYKCCDWCEDIVGSYTYPNVPDNLFQRHDNCRCTVIYDGSELKAHKNKAGKANTFRLQ